MFRRLVAAAFALVVLTLLAVNYALTTHALRVGAPVDSDVRTLVLAICLGAAVVALFAGLLVSRALTSRVRRLKRAAEGLLGPEAQPAGLSDPNDDLGSLERSLTGVGHELRGLVSNLRFESARREAILSGMAEGVLAVDPDLKVTFCNQALLAAIGFRGSRYEGFGLLQLVRDPTLYEMIRSVRTTGERGTLRFHLSADIPRTLEAQATPLAMPSGRGVIAIFHDITDLERLEQVRKDFVANVSHELRTPLAGIIGYADTLLDGALDDTANRRKFVEIIRANAVRLGSIAADLLVLSELESGADQESEMVSVRAALESGLLTVHSEARERQVRLVREEMQDVCVAGSRLRLEQAFLNLLANAIKFNRAEGEVRVRVTQNDEGRVAVVISDTGVGIPSQDLPRIFERFYRVDKARSRQVGGTGLGLSIVKHVIERMNGTVTVDSQVGKGTTFQVLLPAASKVGRVHG
ncbi:MAG TPA: ATP-binding protein [Bryobacteraceae bacterium]|nr:ATP-binding protein [Bryobacteraceae bacterium]